MTVITPIRADSAYFGLSKETTPGTPVAPAWFPRWMDGSSIEFNLKTEEVWEGDGSRRLSQLVKNQQSVKIKLVCSPRMNELAFLEEAAMGSGSDSITTTTPNTTTNTAITGGVSTTVGLVSGTGFSGSGGGNFWLLVGTGTATDPYEVVKFAFPSSGTTLTVAATYNGGVFKLSHPSGTNIASIATVNTSVTHGSIAGATTVQIGGNTSGLTGSGNVVVMLAAGTVNEEIVPLVAPGSGGILNVATSYNGGNGLKFPHGSPDSILSPISHVLTDQYDGDYFTVEVALGSLNGAAGTTLRVRTCKVNTCKIMGKAGGLLLYELELEGIAASVQSTPATVSLEQHPLFLYTQGVWTLDSSAGGDALNIDNWAIERKNNTSLVQTEQVIGAAIIFGNVTVGLTFDVVYTNANRVFLIYFGSTSGTTDAQAIGAGAFSVTFTQPDTFESVTYTMLTTHYSKTGMPAPKKDGKEFKLASITAMSVSNMGANAYVLQTTVGNSQAAMY